MLNFRPIGEGKLSFQLLFIFKCLQSCLAELPNRAPQRRSQCPVLRRRLRNLHNQKLGDSRRTVNLITRRQPRSHSVRHLLQTIGGNSAQTGID
jgi:hypothetical protein